MNNLYCVQIDEGSTGTTKAKSGILSVLYYIYKNRNTIGTIKITKYSMRSDLLSWDKNEL